MRTAAPAPPRLPKSPRELEAFRHATVALQAKVEAAVEASESVEQRAALVSWWNTAAGAYKRVLAGGGRRDLETAMAVHTEAVAALKGWLLWRPSRLAECTHCGAHNQPIGGRCHYCGRPV